MIEKRIMIRADLSDDPEIRKRILTKSLENNLLDIIIRDADLERFNKLGRFNPILIDGSEIISDGSKGVFITIQKGDDQEKAKMMAGRSDFIVVAADNWKVITFENLIAAFHGSGTLLYAQASGVAEAELLLEALEKGVDGIVISPEGSGDIGDIADTVSPKVSGKLDLVSGEVMAVDPIGTGDRVCVDTCSILNMGEGMLVGSQSGGMFLVHSETVPSDYVDTRPFRVNAGPVHSYTAVPGDRTMYLSDMRVGTSALAVDKDGNTRPVVIGRLKIERRPLLLLVAEYERRRYNIILQNAETIRLVSGGEPVSVVDLEKGDPVLMRIENGGRHFGMKVDETVTER